MVTFCYVIFHPADVAIDKAAIDRLGAGINALVPAAKFSDTISLITEIAFLHFY
jgi:uncharacterized MnhB-related membrane protein